jgi:phosphomannomutase
MTRAPGELSELAQAWISGDPDPDTRAELQVLLEQKAWGELERRLTPLSFGTAGLRGEVGAGSGCMNLAVVIRTAYAITQHVLGSPQSAAPVVVGFDARPTSRAFAEASAGVLLAAGLEVVAFAEPCPTPFAAFVGRELGAAATIVVTASHNPRPDNGYKVYGPDAVQISAPTDSAIAALIEQAPPAREVPRQLLSFGAGAAGLSLVGAELVDRYFSALARALPAGREGRSLAIVHSALHGVGSAPMQRALGEAGFTRVLVVSAQAEPDGSFPTTAFPNPEEPGTLALGLAEANAQAADLLLVNDPDADRLAAAARCDGVLTALDGNQLGMLLADALLARAPPDRTPLVLSSVVSSPLVERLCHAAGARHERTHTGFKWLWHAALALEAQRAGRFCFAYEEALGYSVFPAVRDKDGIAAGRALAELSASLSTRQATLFDRLFELYAEHGLWASAARNVTLEGSDAGGRIAAALDKLVSEPRFELVGQRVTRRIDYRERHAAEQRPPWLGAAQLLELELESGARVLVRPSGTEAKLKLYAHTLGRVAQREALTSTLVALRRFAGTLLLELEQRLRI